MKANKNKLMITKRMTNSDNTKWMIPRNKCQSYEQANELLLKKKYQYWEEINKILKTNISAINNQINHR